MMDGDFDPSKIGDLNSQATLDDTLAEILTDEQKEEHEAQNPRDIMARMKERQQERINEKVEALRPILDDSQLHQYRSSLESKSGGIIGRLLQGLDGNDE